MLINLTMKTMMFIAVFTGLLSLGTVIGIRSLLKGNNSAAPSDPKKTEETAQESIGGKSQPPGNLRAFIIYSYNDPMAGMEAFRLLLPKGWQADGGVAWVANPALPAQFHFRFYNPSGREEFDLFPTQAYFWTDNQLFLFSFKAEKGKLDSQSKIFQTMIYSLKVNPPYFAKVANVKEQLAQMAIQGIHAVGRIGNMIARASSEMRADQQQAWEQRQQAQDRIAQNFSDYIRGVERFNDPFAGKEVELPAGYGHAWANNLGEYVVTDSPNYNPNIGSNLHWEPLPPVK